MAVTSVRYSSAPSSVEQNLCGRSTSHDRALPSISRDLLVWPVPTSASFPAKPRDALCTAVIGERALGVRFEGRLEGLMGCTSCARWLRGNPHSCLLDASST